MFHSISKKYHSITTFNCHSRIIIFFDKIYYQFSGSSQGNGLGTQILARVIKAIKKNK